MKRIRNLVIGGIQNKVFNLIVFTVVLISAVNLIVYLYHSRMLTQLAEESNSAQQTAIAEITDSVMDQVAVQTLARSNKAEALIVDNMFEAAQNRVGLLADYAEKMFANPEDYTPQPYAGPDLALEGVWAAKVIYADGVDPEDPAIRARAGLVANLSGIMESICKTSGTDTVYIALPEGVHFSMSAISSGWFEDGKVKSYDPRSRAWYKKAVEEGTTIFTNGEWDAATGSYCTECAAPVYGPDGSLMAVVGTDLFLDEMQAVMESSLTEGEYQLLVNKDGGAVLEPQAEAFPMAEADRGSDLRSSKNELLSKVVGAALNGEDVGVLMGELENGAYYITASSMETSGWVLISAYTQENIGKPAAMLADENRRIQEEAAEVYQAKTDKSKQTATVLSVLAAILMLAGSLVLGKRIVDPLNNITRRIAALREGDLEFKMEDAYRTGDEIEELAESFATLSHKTVQYVDTVKKVTAEKERIGTELSLATQIQGAMLPHIVPAFPDRTDFDICGSMEPAKEVGGDFFDYFLIDEDHLGMVIADVSGKGVPAALFMMASKIILQSVAMLGNSPGEVLSKTNEAICSNNEAEMFVTVWFGILELSSGRLKAANAGHEYPVLKRPDGTFEKLKDKHGFVLGAIDGAIYKEYEIMLEKGTKLFQYTDGIPEAANTDDEMFGMERMIEALNEGPDATPEELLVNVREAVREFVGDAQQFDDMTMLCVEYKGK